MAPMQKRAWWGLAIGLAFIVAFILVFFLMGGIETFDENTNFRLTIDALMIAALVANLVIVNLPLTKPGMADERDHRVIEWAPRVQWLAVIFTLVAWTIGLTEHYHDTGLVPSVYLFIVFMSVLVVSTVAQCLGILIGYWRYS
jgi:small-conductance mechanosensitive channel